MKHRITVSVYKGDELRDKFAVDFIGDVTKAAKVGDEYAAGMLLCHDKGCEAKVHIKSTSMDDAA